MAMVQWDIKSPNWSGRLDFEDMLCWVSNMIVQLVRFIDLDGVQRLENFKFGIVVTSVYIVKVIWFINFD